MDSAELFGGVTTTSRRPPLSLCIALHCAQVSTVMPLVMKQGREQAGPQGKAGRTAGKGRAGGVAG